MMKTGKRIRSKRKFSEEFKRKLVEDFEQGRMSVLQIGRDYDLSPELIYQWIYKFSTYNKKNVRIVEIKDSQTNKLKELENQVRELQRVVGQKHMTIDYLDTMIDLAEEQYGVDIKKNSNIQPCGGSKTTNKS